MALLVLGAFSLVGHFVVDLVHPPHLPTIQQATASVILDTQDAGHATSLHGAYLLTAIPRLPSAKAPLHLSASLAPLEIAWQPATPLRPPISF